MKKTIQDLQDQRTLVNTAWRQDLYSLRLIGNTIQTIVDGPRTKETFDDLIVAQMFILEVFRSTEALIRRQNRIERVLVGRQLRDRTGVM